MAETIWCETGKKAGVGSGNKDFSPESGKCAKDSPTKMRKIEDNTLACLCSSNEKDNTPKKEQEKDKAPGKALENIGSVKRRIATTIATTPEVAEVNTATVSTSTKGSCTRASSPDFLEAFHLSILHNREAGESNQEAQELTFLEIANQLQVDCM